MRLKDLREDANLTQNTIAEMLHIRQNTYSQYENGQRQVPIEVLVKVSKIYGTSVDYILGLTDIREAYPKKGYHTKQQFYANHEKQIPNPRFREEEQKPPEKKL